MGHFMDECKRIMIAVINMCGLLIGGAGGDAHWSQTYFFPSPH